MGVEALYPKPRLSVPGAPDDGAKRSPYLLRGVTVARRDHVWSTDITDTTYVRLQHGFLYLVAVLDWYSCYVVAWELSNTAVQYGCPIRSTPASVWRRWRQQRQHWRMATQ